MPDTYIDPSEELASKIKAEEKSGVSIETTLTTDERVLARITDGIYRQPSSALRELISNAYDADASTVTIHTDAPRFDKIIIRDDGNGFTTRSLANLVYHIGGSPKRTWEGVELNVVNSSDPSLSPRGRKLIGKVGIGLFSVAQLTRHFQIITKTKGEKLRRVADVILRTHSEADLAELKKGDKKRFETGQVRIWSVPATDINSQGTEIILMDLHKQTKDLLRSRDRWLQLDSQKEDVDAEVILAPPKYHIGRFDAKSSDLITEKAHLPWKQTDKPEARFKKLVQAVINEVGITELNPKLETTLDNYLRTLWILSLSAPLDYIVKHPFDLNHDDGIRAFRLSNNPSGQADEINLQNGNPVRDYAQLTAPDRGAALNFNVTIDGVQLFRPIRFTDLPKTSHSIATPLLFVGKCDPDLRKIPAEIRGGDLSFEAYLFWTPKVVPKEHNGILIRIADASGTLFDETFMKYQVSEQTRLRQITAEIFVTKGLDAALNIDRESFNYAHPHFQFISKWIHRALRQFATKHKAIAKGIRTEKLASASTLRTTKLQNIAIDEVSRASGDKSTEPSEVLFLDSQQEVFQEKRSAGALVFDKAVVFAPKASKKKTPNSNAEDREFELKIQALTQLLEAYGLLEQLSYEKQQELLRAVVRIFASEEIE